MAVVDAVASGNDVGVLDITTSGAVNNSGTISGSNITANIYSLDNTGTIVSSGIITINSAGALVNSGLINSDGDIIINSASLDNSNSYVVDSSGNLIGGILSGSKLVVSASVSKVLKYLHLH